MCTAIKMTSNDFYFGRTFDYEFSYGENIVIVPRNFKFEFSEEGTLQNHYAIIGIAHISNSYPLLYDAVNEKGLAMAGLNFTKSAKYFKSKIEKINVSQYEFIPYVLSNFSSVSEFEKISSKLNITDTPFSKDFSPSYLHWIIADKERAITVEQTENGIKVYQNLANVLTNEPPFDFQMHNLSNYLHLSVKNQKNTFAKNIPLTNYSRGMGAMGLPGDWSSQSRFVRAAFTLANSFSDLGEKESVSRFFHILSSVSQIKGLCDVGGKYEYTIYTSCCNVDKGIYYYTTYNNSKVKSVCMHSTNLEGSKITKYSIN